MFTGLTATLRKFRLTHWSTYFAFTAWGVAGFMGQPTLASLVVHIGVMPIVLFVMIKLARHEGKMDFVRSQTAQLESIVKS